MLVIGHDRCQGVKRQESVLDAMYVLLREATESLYESPLQLDCRASHIIAEHLAMLTK